MNIHGRGVDPHGSLSGVLRAATAPAHPSELAGEEAAVTAFLAAEPAPRRSLVARILTVKAVIVAAAAVSTGVVVAATGDLPWTHTPNQPPADPPSVTDPASVPAMTQPAGPPPSSSTSDPPGPETPPSTASVPNGPGNERDQSEKKQDKPDRDGKEDDRNKDGSGHSMPTTGPTEPQRNNNSQTPGSTARGAVTAVPPNGAKPPSPGG